MTIQSQLNQHIINFIKKIKELINTSADFEANQMNYTLKAMNNSYQAIEDMTKQELQKFADDLIKYKL